MPDAWANALHDMLMLELVLKKKWFDLIQSGEKTEEYREINAYWCSRILTSPYHVVYGEHMAAMLPNGYYNEKHHQVRFRLGYGKNAPEMKFKILGIKVGMPRPEWSEPNPRKSFVIELGERILQS